MSDGNGLTSLFADRKISTKVAAGFGVVLLILAVSSSIAYLSFGQTAVAIGNYATLVRNSSIYQDIDQQVTQYRGHVREFVYSGNEETAATAIKDGEALRRQIADGLTRITNPDRHRLLEDAAKQADAYALNFEHEHAMLAEQAKLETETLDVVGAQLSDGFSAILADAIKADNAAAQPLAIEGRRLSLMLRLDANKRLGRHDEAASKADEQHAAELLQVLAKLDAATKDTGLNAAVKNEASLIDRYQTAFRRASSLDTDKVTLMNGVMRQAGETLAADAVKAKAKQRRGASRSIEKDAMEVADRGETDGHGIGSGSVAPGRRAGVVDRPRDFRDRSCACARRCAPSRVATRRSRCPASAARTRSARWPRRCRCSRTA